MLNLSKGEMYPWCTHTWNFIKGECSHNCSYCYVKRFPVGPLRLDEKCLKDDLGKNNVIFVGSSTDMWADKVPDEWIKRVLDYCKRFDNTYLFQSKNPKRFRDFTFPCKTILGTTIETNDITNYPKYSKAPLPSWRLSEMAKLPKDIDKMVSIEPIMDFNESTFHNWIKDINPKFVSIGADSKGHNLPEPSAEKIKKLISRLKEFTDVRIKDNLKRLM